MRDILEALPHALLPDPARESEDPGIAREVYDDDLVRPFVEEDVPVRGDSTAGRSRRSPLARDVEIVVDPFDPRMPTPIGVTLYVEGQRVRQATITLGQVHQGIERRAVGLGAHSGELFALVAAVAPGVVAQLAVALAAARLRGDDDARSPWHTAALELIFISEHAAVLADVARRLPVYERRLRAVVDASRAALAGLDLDAHLASAAPFGTDDRAMLRRRVDDIGRALAQVDVAGLLDALSPLRGVGVVTLARARELGVDGPSLAAAGGQSTVAVELGAAQRPAPLTSASATGCVVARAQVRSAALAEGAARVRAWLDALDALDVEKSAGATSESPGAREVRDGTTQACVHGPGGTLSCVMHVRAGVVQRLRLRPPELPSALTVPGALRGTRLDDVSEVIASFGLRASALDR